ncbi:MAG TPA: hypothetical protein VHQ43_07830 [Solirubrobacterales bacterium]|nr:hypothetical protein [Solirubrobacterales bacterium]
MAPLFGFAQFEFAGTLGVADGRYLARGEAPAEEQSVLVVETLGAPAAAPKRRRRQREGDPAPPPLPLTRVTAVRAAEPFSDAAEAERWLEESLAAEDRVEALIAEGASLLNRALHARAVAAADPGLAETGPEHAVSVRLGYGSGEEVAEGSFTAAQRVAAGGGARSRRRQREEELRPQERIAAVLGGRERIDACETLLLRARADLDAGRRREAALQLRVALEATLVELAGALADPGHEEDMATLEARRGEAGEAANQALRGDLSDETERQVRELVETAERVLRRRRVLRG